MKNQDLVEIGLQIYRARKENRLSSEVLGKQCGVTGEHIRAIEAGRRLPSLTLLIKICNVLKVSPNHIFAPYLTFDNPIDELHTKIDMMTKTQRQKATTIFNLVLDFPDKTKLK